MEWNSPFDKIVAHAPIPCFFTPLFNSSISSSLQRTRARLPPPFAFAFVAARVLPASFLTLTGFFSSLSSSSSSVASGSPDEEEDDNDDDDDDDAAEGLVLGFGFALLLA